MTLSLDELGLTDPANASGIAQRSTFSKSMTIRISTDVLWVSDDPTEQAYDWLAVLMFGEFLASFATKPSYKIVRVDDKVMAVDFTLHQNITSAVIHSVMQYGAALLAFQTDGTATCYFERNEIRDYETEFFAFRDHLDERVETFHDLAAIYAETYIAGQLLYGDDASEHHLILDKWLDNATDRKMSA